MDFLECKANEKIKILSLATFPRTDTNPKGVGWGSHFDETYQVIIGRNFVHFSYT